MRSATQHDAIKRCADAQDDEARARLRWLSAVVTKRRTSLPESALPYAVIDYIMDADWREIPVEHWRPPKTRGAGWTERWPR